MDQENNTKSYIYEIENTINNKRYIGIIENTDDWKKEFQNIVFQLDEGFFFNNDILLDWRTYGGDPDAFILTILEEVDHRLKLRPRQYKIAKKYNSHIQKFGYNFTDTWYNSKDDWEIETDLQRKNEKWLFKDDINKKVRLLLNSLDYNLQVDKARVSLLNGKLDNYFTDYLSSVGFRDKQVKKKINALSTFDPFCMSLENMSNYLLFAPVKTGTNNDEHYPLLSNRKIDYRVKKEIRIDYYDIACDDELDEQYNNQPNTRLKKVSLDEKKYRRLKKALVNKNMNVLLLDEQKHHNDKYNEKNLMLIKKESDMNRFNDFIEANTQIQQTIKSLEKWLKDPKLNEHWMKNNFIYATDEKKALNSEVRRIKNKVLPEIKKDLSTVKEQLIRRFKFNTADSSTEITLEYDTGYVDDEGEYKLVSENKFDFGDFNHVSGLISCYSSIQDYNKRIETELYHILSVFNDLTSRIYLKDYERDILYWHIYDDCPITAVENEYDKEKYGDKVYIEPIVDKLKSKYGLNYDQPRVSRLLKEKIPRLIVNAYKQSYEDYIYTYKLKGAYKQCIKCGQIKLLNNNNYRKRHDKQGIFRAECRDCEKVAKNIHKT